CKVMMVVLDWRRWSVANETGGRVIDVPVVGTVALGFVLGMRHALDADHVAAVATLTRSGDGLRRVIANGFSWGFGHAVTIGVAGGVAIVLRTAIPERLALIFEFAVGLMLVVLGFLALRGALREKSKDDQHQPHRKLE